MLYLYFSLYLYLYLDSGSRKRITLAEMRAFATFKSFSVPYGKAFFFFFFCKIIIDFSSLGYQLRWPRSLWAFFLIVEKSDTDRSRAFLSPQITRERCGTRFVDKLELSARRTSIVISIASVHSLAQYSRAVVRTHGRVCGYMWIYSVRGVYFGAPTAKPQTRGLARPNLKPKPTLLPRG